MDEIESFKAPDEAGIDSVNVLLVGEVSAGKSSFFNSVDSVFKGRVMTKAHTGVGSQWTEASLTTQVTTGCPKKSVTFIFKVGSRALQGSFGGVASP